MFEELAAPLVDGLFQGYNGTVLAYGQVKLSSSPVQRALYVHISEVEASKKGQKSEILKVLRRLVLGRHTPWELEAEMDPKRA